MSPAFSCDLPRAWEPGEIKGLSLKSWTSLKLKYGSSAQKKVDVWVGCLPDEVTETWWHGSAEARDWSQTEMGDLRTSFFSFSYWVLQFKFVSKINVRWKTSVANLCTGGSLFSAKQSENIKLFQDARIFLQDEVFVSTDTVWSV